MVLCNGTVYGDNHMENTVFKVYGITMVFCGRIERGLRGVCIVYIGCI